ncbi:MAG: DUF885 family protein [Bacteroidota bacterium]
MKYTSFVPLALFALCLSCSGPIEKKPPTQTPAEFFEEYHEAYLRLNPLTATFVGDNRYNDTIPNFYTEAAREQNRIFNKKYLDKASAYDPEQLSKEDALSMKLLMYECRINLEGDSIDFPSEYMPLSQLGGFHTTYGMLASGTSAQPFNNARDFDNWLSRLEDYMPIIDTVMANMKKGINTGYVLPKPLIEKLIPQLEDLATLPVEENVVYSPIKSMPDSIAQKEKQRLTAAYETMGLRLIGKFRELTDFVKTDYLAAGRSTSGIGSLPNGSEAYNFLIKYYTTTDLNADEVFDIGMQEVKRIRGEMEAVKERVGYEGDLLSFFDFVRENPELMPFDDPQQVIDNYNTMLDIMKPHLDSLFNIQPKTPFEVRRIEAFREATSSAHYIPGSLDGTRPGIFYVPIPDVKRYNFFADENTFLHEAIPGHHFQISIQQENQDIPEFRKILGYGAFAEGWGLYAESGEMGLALGLYQDPYQYFGMLSWDMHRALRLVTDAGIHSKGWSREKAIQFSLDNEAESEATITSEIERYMANPGQALSYKIGQLKILELREKAMNELGHKFDIRGFHDIVLLTGSVPLSIL